jgi:hypothetical protein
VRVSETVTTAIFNGIKEGILTLCVYVIEIFDAVKARQARG